MHLRKSPWMLILAYGCISACGDDENKNATIIDPVFEAACRLVSCPETAECVVLGSGQTDCQCQIGYQGEACDRCESDYHRDSKDRCVPDKSCAEQDPCEPNGVCSDKTGVVECKCAARYAGPRCTVCAPPYRPGPDGDCVTALDGAVEDAGLDASSQDAAGLDATVEDSSAPPVDSSVPPVDSSVPPVDSSVPPVDSSVPPVDSSVPPVDSSVPPVDSSVPPVDSSVPDASVCTTQISTQDFEGLPSWPLAINTCGEVASLTAGSVVLRSRNGLAPVRRCAPSTLHQLTSRHVELVARGVDGPAVITLNQPASFVSFRAGAAASPVSVDILVDDTLVRTLSLGANTSQLVTLNLTVPATKISLRNATNFNQNICIDDIEHHTQKCP